ncbi:M48 family metallopeptidase [Halomonas sp.]|uniref:M48 family metallopeptidase n=1 Tax=Halomonas sp. TaxID=1486246 RepID=UPI00260A806D|nr:M48 family metallopeptidase [Halomonas sp.]
MTRFVWMLVGLALLLAGCSETPTGRSRLALVPDGMLAEMGEQSFAEMRRRRPEVTGTPANALVQCVSREVAAAAGAVYPGVSRPDAWEVVLLEDPSPNAFALPGGRIGVHTGLLRVAESPAQLAAVLGHEVAHVLAEHGNERLTQRLGIRAVLLVAGAFSEGDLAGDTLMRALGLGAHLGIALPFSRAHEEEADAMGLAIMAEAGFDPRESVALWRNMAAAGDGQPPEFLSTHPAHASRIAGLEAAMDAALARYREATPARCG